MIPETQSLANLAPLPAGQRGSLSVIAGSERTCANCKYKMTAGSMVDPCFPCLHEHSIFTGEPKAKYDAWTDERLSWEEVRQREQETHDAIQRSFDESPELRELLAKLFPPNPAISHAASDAGRSP